MSSSPVSQLFSGFAQDLNNAFANAFQLQTPYREEDLIAGDRFGIISLQSFEADPNLPAMANVPGGIVARRWKGLMILAIGCSDRIAAEQEFMETCLDFEHRFAAMKQAIPSREGLRDITVLLPIDQAPFVSLRGDVWVTRVTAELQIKIAFHQGVQGEQSVFRS